MSDKTLKTVKEIGQLARRRPFRVSIEGNIGSGKSTVIRQFERLRSVEVHPEPLHEWRDVGGHNLLGLLYADPRRWGFTFQHYVHLSRLRIQTSVPRDPLVTVKMFERSVQNSRHCFVECALREGYLSPAEYDVLLSWFDFTERNLDTSLDLIVYLRSTPETAWQRMRSRGRSEEADVPLEYLQQVHEAYERWLGGAGAAGCAVLALDADRPLAAVLRDVAEHAPLILGQTAPPPPPVAS